MRGWECRLIIFSLILSLPTFGFKVLIVLSNLGYKAKIYI